MPDDTYTSPAPEDFRTLDLEPTLSKPGAGPSLIDSIRATELVNQAATLRSEKRYKEAIALAEKATRLDPNHILAWNMLGASYEDDGQLAAAAVAYLRSTEVGGDHYDASYSNYNLGRLASDAGRGEAAVEHLTRALSIRPNYPLAHRWLGWEYERRGELQLALAQYEEAIADDPNNEDARNAALKLRRRLGGA